MPDIAEKETDDWLSLLGRKLFGDKPKKEEPAKAPVFRTDPPTAIQQEPPSKEYPGPAELETSKAVEQYYGNPFAAYFTPGLATTKVVKSHADAESLFQSGMPAGKMNLGRAEWVDPERADRIHAGWLAAERSPVASMGFDPSKTIESRSKPGQAVAWSGAYQPAGDRMWYDAKTPFTMVHESMHRGIRKLEKDGLLPENVAAAVGQIGTTSNAFYHEMLVRALMSRHFGDIEMGLGKAGDQQIRDARNIVPEHYLDSLENAAAQYIARKRPGGPR
jgi:hypothetical protein